MIVMSDLNDGILGSDHIFTRDELVGILERIDRLHRTDLHTPHVTSLMRLVSLFSTPGLRAAGAGALADDVERGWMVFADLAPFAAPVLDLVTAPEPVVAALAARRSALCHGDLAAVNLGWQGDDLILLDWGQAFRGPPALDVARFLPSGLVDSAVHPETFLDDYRVQTGDRFDAEALDLSVLATLVWYGWKKALDVVETDDPQRGGRELDNLLWLCERAQPALRALGTHTRP